VSQRFRRNCHLHLQGRKSSKQKKQHVAGGWAESAAGRDTSYT
jgi:hypothetical protein